MIRLKSGARRWIVAAAAALLAAGVAIMLFVPGLPTSDYFKYRLAAGKFMKAGILDAGLDDYRRPLTRFEFARIINRAYGFTDVSEAAFTDVADDEQALEINRAVTQGYMTAPGGKADPGAPVSREQAALALWSLFMLPEGGAILFEDAGEIDPGALAKVSAVVERGLLAASSDRFRPGDPLTVEEAVLMLQAAVGTPFGEPGSYTSRFGGKIYGNVTLSSGNIALCDTVVTGDVYITRGAAEGIITLDGVRVEGRILIEGSGAVLFNDVECGQVIVGSPFGDPLRVAAMGRTRLDETRVLSDARIEETGLEGDGFVNISFEKPGGSGEISCAADSVFLSGKAYRLELAAGAFVRSMTVWVKASIAGDGAVTLLTVHDGPLVCGVIPETADILTNSSVTLAGIRFSGTPVTVFGSDLSGVLRDAAELAVSYQEGDTADTVTRDLGLPAQGASGSAVTWESSDPAHISADGTVIRADYPLGDFEVTLTARVTKGNVSKELTFDVTVMQKEITPRQSVDADAAAIMIGFGAGDSADGIIHDIVLPASGSNGTSIAWSSSAPGTLSPEGIVNRPATGNKTVTLTATVTKEDATATREFTIVVRKKIAFTQEQMLEEDRDTLRIVYAPGDSAGSVTQSLLLPGSGVNGSIVTWSSSAVSAIGSDGHVTRPSAADGDQAVTLTATIKLGDKKATKTFSVTVIALAPEPTPAPTTSP